MSTQTVRRSMLALVSLAGVASGPASAASVTDYAKSAISETFLSEPRRRSLSIAFAGHTPPQDRAAVTLVLTPFVWVTNVPNRISDVAEADLVVVHLKSFKQLGPADVDPRIAPVVQQNSGQLRQGGACTKIIETRPGSGRRGYVFLSLEDNEELRKSCLYGHVRALFGLREEGEAGEFADTFLADLAIARCISQMAPPQPTASASDAKAAIVQALAANSCGQERR